VTHGDEYERPVGLKIQLREFNRGRLASGCLIVIPVLNNPAFRAAKLDSLSEVRNMNRAIAGDA
jgi:N2-acetyl-L-2,4-diaminobutanoate deacetylase